MSQLSKTVKINGVDKTNIIRIGSLRISDNVNERSTASISIFDSTGSFRPEVGQTVEINDGIDLIFSGSIDDVPEEKVLGANALRYDSIPLVDYHQTADRRIVAEVYENELAGNIVKDIRTKYLADENITAGTIQDGPEIEKAVFNYIPASQCFDELSELTGLQWVIRPDKTLHFFDRSTFIGDPITSESPIRNVRVRRHRDGYRNRQYLRAGKDVSTTQTRTFKGDGETQVFAVELPIAKVPTVKVNGVAKTVGIRGLETGFDWYWNKNDKTISQDESGTKLTSSDILTVEFQGFYPIIVVADDVEEISDRKTNEGGTGIYESIEEKASLDNKKSATDYANALLRRYAKISTSLTFDTFTSTYLAGQIVNVTIPEHNISEDMLISRINISDPGIADGRLNYSLELVSGEVVGGWTNFFKKLVQQNKSFVIRENEILLKLLSVNDSFKNLSLTDNITHNLHQYWICGQESGYVKEEAILAEETEYILEYEFPETESMAVLLEYLGVNTKITCNALLVGDSSYIDSEQEISEGLEYDEFYNLAESDLMTVWLDYMGINTEIIYECEVFI